MNHFSSQAPTVRGMNVDTRTRCVHYRSAADIVAIKIHDPPGPRPALAVR